MGESQYKWNRLKEVKLVLQNTYVLKINIILQEAPSK